MLQAMPTHTLSASTSPTHDTQFEVITQRSRNILQKQIRGWPIDQWSNNINTDIGHKHTRQDAKIGLHGLNF
jgi:hypothetical protein